MHRKVQLLQRKRPNEIRLDHRDSILSSSRTKNHVRLIKYCKTFFFILVLVVSAVVLITKITTNTREISTPTQKLVPQPVAHIMPDRMCNRGNARSCECARSDPLKPKTRGDLWKRAFDMNLALLASINSKGDGDEALDVVLLGDSITEDWNGRRLGKPNSFSLPIETVFKSLFRKESGGRVNGIALGISGDRVRRITRIHHE